jgi:hypothetical protein
MGWRREVVAQCTFGHVLRSSWARLPGPMGKGTRVQIAQVCPLTQMNNHVDISCAHSSHKSFALNRALKR